MKHNVDLTLNRKFRENGSFSSNRVDAIRIASLISKPSELAPWNKMFKQLKSLDNLKKNGLFPTGNIEDIKLKRKWEQEKESLNFSNCERCGVRITKLPWRYDGDLCKKCEDWLDEKYSDKIPWRRVNQNR